MAKVTEAQATRVLNAVAEWMGTKGYGTPICPHGQTLHTQRFWLHENGTECTGQKFGPAPTGKEAAYDGRGPELVMLFDWVGEPHPAIVLEGGPEDWAVQCSFAVQRMLDAQASKRRLFVEPATGWALSIHPA